VTSTITGTQSGITINPAAVSFLGVYGFPSPVSAGVETTFAVTAQDAFGNYHPRYLGTVHFTSSDAAASLPADYTFVASDNGSHDFSATFNTGGYQSLTATDTVTATITGTAAGIYVNGGATDSLSVAGFPSPSTAGVAGTFTVTALNPRGGTDRSYRGTVYFTSSDAQAALPANYTFAAADNGVHNFSVTLKTAGTQSITATDTTTASITGTQSGITVVAAAASQFAVSTSAANPDIAGTPFDVTVTAQDAYGNTATSYTGTVHFTSGDPYGARFPADYTFQAGGQGVHTFAAGATLYTAGTWDVTGTDTASGISGAAFVNVQAAPAVAFQVVAPASATSGVAFDVTVIAVDPYGNTDRNYTGTIHFTTSDMDPGVVLPPDYTFQPSDAGMVTFPGGVTLITLGGQTLTATDTVSGITGSAMSEDV
jgi:hypothetical protein